MTIQLDTIEQIVLIILSIALSITILFAIILLFKKKYLITSDQSENDDEFMIISNTDQMIAIKKSESASFDQDKILYPKPTYPINK